MGERERVSPTVQQQQQLGTSDREVRVKEDGRWEEEEVVYQKWSAPSVVLTTAAE